MASRSPIILDSSHSRSQAVDAFSSAPSSSPVVSKRRLHLYSMGSGLSSGLGMLACSRSSPGRRLSGPSQPPPRLLVRRFVREVGCSPPGHNCFRTLVSGGSSVVIARELRAVEFGVRQFHLLVANSTVAVFVDNSTALAYLRK